MASCDDEMADRFHAEADRVFGPRLRPDCAGSVWARDGEGDISAVDPGI